MYPVLLPFLLLAAMNSGSIAILQENNTGQKFIVVFPENIAFYHPYYADNKIQITALHDNTVVRFSSSGYIRTVKINAGQSSEVNISSMELGKSEVSSLTTLITSNMDIIVCAISRKDKSMQTALVIPTDKLGKEYLIPPTPTIQGTTDDVTIEVTERNPFRLLIISVDQETTATVDGSISTEVSLAPLHVAQVWLHKANELRTVTSDQPVAVLFGHPCAMRHNCTCGMLYNILPPAKKDKVKFLIPPVLAEDANSDTFLLLSETGSTAVEAFDPDSPIVEAAGTAMFYRPGLLLPLIPETDFGACFMVSPIPGVQSSVVIVVHKDFTDGVHIGNGLLQSPDWQEMKGTEYVSTEVELVQQTFVIWHSSSKMAVYFWGKNGDALFAHPAAIIGKNPDFRGCTLISEVMHIGEVAVGWPESIKYCKDNNLNLISLFNSQLWTYIYEKLIQVTDDKIEEVWIGMRRRSLNGDWYWLNSNVVNETNWEKGEPGHVSEGQCAIMSLENGKWSDEDCCKAAHPVCYRAPVLLPLGWAGPPPAFGSDSTSDSGSKSD